MNKILLSGYYGMKNTGDDALLAVTSWGVKTFLKADKMIATAAQIPQFAGSHLIQPAYVEERRFRGENKLRLYYHALRSQHILLGGGSVFHSSGQMNEVIDILRLSGKGPHAALGVSLGPFRDSGAEKTCVSLLKRFAFVGLRDQVSFEIAQQIAPCVNSEKTFDLAVLLPKSTNYIEDGLKSDGDRRGIGLALCNYERYIGGDINKEELCKQKVIQALSQLDPEEAGPIVLIDFNGHPFYGDYELHSEVAERLRSRFNVQHLAYNPNPIAVLRQLAGVRCLVAMRLHAAIFGYIAQTPTIMLPYHNKCLAWSFEIGMQQELVLNRDRFEINDLTARIRDIISEKLNKPSLPFNVAENLAMRNWLWANN